MSNQMKTNAYCTPERLQEIAAIHCAMTPGPYSWRGYTGSKSIDLMSDVAGRKHVMGFRRYGMRGAQPVFRRNEGGMADASELFITAHEESKTIIGIDSYDARGLAASWGMVDDLLKHTAAQAKRIAELEKENEHLKVVGRFAEQSVEELHEEIGRALELLPKTIADSPLHLDTWQEKSILDQVLESTRMPTTEEVEQGWFGCEDHNDWSDEDEHQPATA